MEAMYNNTKISLLQSWPTCNTVLLDGWLGVDQYCRWEL